MSESAAQGRGSAGDILGGMDHAEMMRREMASAATTEPPVKCRRYKHGGARFYTVDEKVTGGERLLADTYNAKATERVAAALGAEVEEA